MRISSLRALLLALAMVLQTIAGGASVARAATNDGGQSVSAHCARLLKQLHANDDAAPEQDSGRGMCPSCLACDEPPTAWVLDLDVSVVVTQRVSRILHPSSDAQGRFARVEQAQSARGPPAA